MQQKKKKKGTNPRDSKEDHGDETGSLHSANARIRKKSFGMDLKKSVSKRQKDFFFFLFCHMEFLGQGSDSSRSCNLRHSSRNAGSLNALCWARESNLCPGAAEMPPMPLHHSGNYKAKYFLKRIPWNLEVFMTHNGLQKAFRSIQKKNPIYKWLWPSLRLICT